MYVIEDRVTPTIQGFMNLLRTKNVFLKYFPYKWINEYGFEVEGSDPSAIKVFDKMYFYNGDVLDTTAHKKIYHLFNIKLNDLQEESYDGVEKYWFELKWEGREDSLDIEDLKTFIDNTLPLNGEGYSDWVTVENIVYDPLDTEAPLYRDDSSITNRLRTSIIDTSYSISEEHICTALALLDTNQDLFETKFIVTHKHLATHRYDLRTDSRYILSANIRLEFRRKTEVTDPLIITYLNKIKDRIDNLNNYSGILLNRYSNARNQLLDTSSTTSVNAQLLEIYKQINPITGITLVHHTSLNGDFIKYDELAALNAHDFSEILGKLLTTDFKKKEASTFVKLLTVAAVFAVIILSAGAGAIAVGGLTGMVATAAFAGTMAFNLALGILALGLISKFAADAGSYGAAAFIGRSIQILGMLSTFLSVISSIGTSPVKFLELSGKSFLTTIKEISFTDLLDVVKTEVIEFTKQSTMKIVVQTTDWLTQAFQAYTKYINPPNAGISEKQAIIDKQKEELEELATPDNLKKVRWIYDTSYTNYLDTNEYMQNIPYLMTQGRVDNATRKYFS